MDLDHYIAFIKEADKLKNISRKTKNYHSENYENSGEHSWHLALATLVFPKEANSKVDLLKCLKMAIIHDLVEIDAGDVIVYDEDPDKFQRELAAAKRIFGLLPEEEAAELLDLWIEFEKKETDEAKYVGSLDRFLPLYSNIIKKGGSWDEHNITQDMIYKKNKPAVEAGSLSLWKKIDGFLQTHFLKKV